MRSSLRWKSIGILACGTTLLAALSIAAFARGAYLRDLEQTAEMASRLNSLTASIIGTVAENKLGRSDRATDPGSGPRLPFDWRPPSVTPPGVDTFVFDREGTLAFSSVRESSDRGIEGLPPELRRAFGGGATSAFTHRTRGETYSWHITTILVNKEIVYYTATRVRATWNWRAIGYPAALVVIGGLAIGGVGVRILSRQLTPLALLSDGAARLAKGEDLLLPRSERRDEVGKLSEALRNWRQSRLHATIEFQEKTASLQSVLRNMLEGVLAVADDETVLLANEAVGRMLGFSPSVAIGRPLVEVARHRSVQTILRRAASEQRPHRDEFETVGEPRRTLSMRAAPLTRSALSGASSGVMLVVHDVTDLRTLENLRREFVANVSHELKTPLAAIKAYAETLRLGALEDSGNRKRFVERIEEQADRLHALITDLLLLARVESGREVYEFIDVALAPLVAECLARFDPTAKQKNIRIDLDEPPSELLVRADVEGLRTIVNNLLDNAIKYTSENGRVCISWRGQDGYAMLEVQDTGIGISARDQLRIFERFYRAEKARSRELGGTGLGLAIVKHLTQAFGGDVALTSSEGQGSTFCVRLPLARTDPISG